MKVAPLADDERGARILALLDHVQEVLFLCLTQRLKLLHCVNVNLQRAEDSSQLQLRPRIPPEPKAVALLCRGCEGYDTIIQAAEEWRRSAPCALSLALEARRGM